jgi:hypothetical protein
VFRWRKEWSRSQPTRSLIYLVAQRRIPTKEYTSILHELAPKLQSNLIEPLRSRSLAPSRSYPSSRVVSLLSPSLTLPVRPPHPGARSMRLQATGLRLGLEAHALAFHKAPAPSFHESSERWLNCFNLLQGFVSRDTGPPGRQCRAAARSCDASGGRRLRGC